MPVYLFTYHAYRSWMPDRPEGFVREGQGIQTPDPRLAKSYAEAAGHPPFRFAPDTQQLLIATAIEVCQRRKWRLHAVATEPTHLHLLLSWRGQARWQDVRGRIRNILSLELSKRQGIKGRPWFSQGASRKRVRNREHFDYLVRRYLPTHSGIKWFEDHG
jgi:REP element-mobilizing transposase RayT